MSIDANPSKGLLAISEVAQILNVSQSTVRRLQQNRKIPFIKVGGSVRFAKGDVDSYIEARRVSAIDPITMYGSQKN